MPIQFRCAACDRLLGIARRKAGTMVNCPRCGASVMVPALAGMAIESPGPGGNSISLSSVSVSKADPEERKKARTEMRRAGESSTPRPPNSLENLPLFERPDFETLLNPALAKANQTETNPRVTTPPATPKQLVPVPIPAPAAPEEAFTFSAPEPVEASNDVDVLSGLVVTRQRLTIAAVIIAVLLGVAFAAGYFLAMATVAAPKKTATPSVVEEKS